MPLLHTNFQKSKGKLSNDEKKQRKKTKEKTKEKKTKEKK